MRKFPIALSFAPVPANKTYAWSHQKTLRIIAGVSDVDPRVPPDRIPGGARRRSARRSPDAS